MLLYFYNLLVFLFYIPYIILIYLRKFINKEHHSKYKEKIFFSKFQRPKGFLFWFHASSIGELNTVFPIVDFFLKKDKNFSFLITTITLSSYNLFVKK